MAENAGLNQLKWTNSFACLKAWNRNGNTSDRLPSYPQRYTEELYKQLLSPYWASSQCGLLMVNAGELAPSISTPSETLVVSTETDTGCQSMHDCECYTPICRQIGNVWRQSVTSCNQWILVVLWRYWYKNNWSWPVGLGYYPVLTSIYVSHIEGNFARFKVCNFWRDYVKFAKFSLHNMFSPKRYKADFAQNCKI